MSLSLEAVKFSYDPVVSWLVGRSFVPISRSEGRFVIISFKDGQFHPNVIATVQPYTYLNLHFQEDMYLICDNSSENFFKKGLQLFYF